MSGVSGIMKRMDYGPGVEDTGAVCDWLAARGDFGHFIGGAFTPPGPPEGMFTSFDPATDAPLARVTQGRAEDMARAVAAARAAQPGWAALSGHERAGYLYAMARTLQRRAPFFAMLETLDTGKPIRESRDMDLPLAVRHFQHHAGWAELCGSEFPGQKPLGVCGQIIAWNSPLLMLARKIAPALAAGNTVVLKPSRSAPLGALAFAEICQQLDLPPGVVNIVTGDGRSGAALVAQDIDMIALTGSTRAGRAIAQAAAGSGKRLLLELGGRSSFIVMDDADLDAAVDGLVDSVWLNQGGYRGSGARILVAEAVAERFEALLQLRMGRLRSGPPLDKSTDMGVFIHPLRKEHILNTCHEAVASGAELIGGISAEGCFIAPGYLRNIAPANPAMSAEELGPIATLSTFRTADEAADLANTCRHGLSASIWSETAAVAMDLAARIKAGMVWINSANLIDAAVPFGGMRDSGYGREGGRAGMLDYLASPPMEPESQSQPVTDTPVAAGKIDRTVQLYIGGAQVPPASGIYYKAEGLMFPLGSRKDIRNAVAAAQGAGAKWAGLGGHGRAQALYGLAENLSLRRAELTHIAGADEVDCAIRRCFFYAGFADKYDGAVVAEKPGHLIQVLPQPHGVMGIACPEIAPLAGLLSLILPAIAMGNTVVVLPSRGRPLAAAVLGQVLDTSNLPGGLINIVTGDRCALATALVHHDEVGAIWYAGDGGALKAIEEGAARTLKPVWSPAPRGWAGPGAQGREFLRRAIWEKSVWLPYGALPKGTGSSAY